MCELLRLSPKNISNTASQHLISSHRASKASQGNLIILQLGRNSGEWFSNQSNWMKMSSTLKHDCIWGQATQNYSLMYLLSMKMCDCLQKTVRQINAPGQNYNQDKNKPIKNMNLPYSLIRSHVIWGSYGPINKSSFIALVFSSVK